MVNEVIKYPVSTEKGIKLMETENKLIFVVTDDSTKNDIKKAVESLFNVKVESVNTFINQGKKKSNHHEKAFDTFFLTLDRDDDGVVDSGERLAIKRIEVIRI